MPHVHTGAQPAVKVAVLGAGGGIGQTLSLLLKTGLAPASVAQQRRVHIALYDVNRDAVAGAATDLSHIDTPVSVSWHAPEPAGGADPLADPLQACLAGAQLVVIPAGVPRKPGMTRDDLFNINAQIVRTLADGIARHCDLARVFVLLISNPVNSLVPVLVETLTQRCRADAALAAQIPRRVFGLTQLDAVRASSFLHQALDCEPSETAVVPVVGGHSGNTILPLFSQARLEPARGSGAAAESRTESAAGAKTGSKIGAKISAKLGSSILNDTAGMMPTLDPGVRQRLVHRVQFGGDEVVRAKNGAGSATLSMAYAGAQVACKFAEMLLGARNEVRDTLYAKVSGHAAVDAITEHVGYFSVPLTITAAQGAAEADTRLLEQMDTYEREQLWPACLAELRESVDRGLEWAHARG
ncbi:LAQU0S23e01156g1_1 [Lachancea quebecensis]|uniref:malate dehydrogenase n=1 Tax=Lachancea quebecensis TaxID=1654605 RepID=A0A0P1KY05_9SACH|nr:LAQU0S23e01156g1_1 [Lachancea quebecensis]